MCINEFESYTEEEKIDLLKDYVDFLYTWDAINYDLFVDLQNNNIRRRKFLKAVVPVWFDEIDYKKVFKSSNRHRKFVKNLKNYATDFPTFYTMAMITGLLECYHENLTFKKLLWRWSKILLNY